MLRDPIGPKECRKHNDPRGKVVTITTKVMRGFTFIANQDFIDSRNRCGWWIIPKFGMKCGFRIVCNAKKGHER